MNTCVTARKLSVLIIAIALALLAGCGDKKPEASTANPSILTAAGVKKPLCPKVCKDEGETTVAMCMAAARANSCPTPRLMDDLTESTLKKPDTSISAADYTPLKYAFDGAVLAYALSGEPINLEHEAAPQLRMISDAFQRREAEGKLTAELQTAIDTVKSNPKSKYRYLLLSLDSMGHYDFDKKGFPLRLNDTTVDLRGDNRAAANYRLRIVDLAEQMFKVQDESLARQIEGMRTTPQRQDYALKVYLLAQDAMPRINVVRASVVRVDLLDPNQQVALSTTQPH